MYIAKCLILRKMTEQSGFSLRSELGDVMPLPHAQDLHSLFGGFTSQALSRAQPELSALFSEAPGSSETTFPDAESLCMGSPLKLCLLSELLLRGGSHALHRGREGKKKIYFSSALLGSPAGALQIRLTKDRWTREKCANVYVLCDMGTFLRKWRPEETVNWMLQLGWMRSGRVQDNVTGQRGMSWGQGTGANLARPVHSDLSQHPLVLKTRMCLSSRFGEHISYMKALWPATGEKEAVR